METERERDAGKLKAGKTARTFFFKSPEHTADKENYPASNPVQKE